MIIFGTKLSQYTRKSVTTDKIQSAKVEPIEGSDLKRVTLTSKASERLGIETAPVRYNLVVPYASVIYGLHGETWVYVNPKPLIFVRNPIVIDYIDGDLAYLREGPSNGTEVVTIGVAELYGAETGVGK